MDDLITESEVEKLLVENGIDKKVFYDALKNGEIYVKAYHPDLKKLMPFRVLEIFNDGSIEGYFVHDKH